MKIIQELLVDLNLISMKDHFCLFICLKYETENLVALPEEPISGYLAINAKSLGRGRTDVLITTFCTEKFGFHQGVKKYNREDLRHKNKLYVIPSTYNANMFAYYLIEYLLGIYLINLYKCLLPLDIFAETTFANFTYL